MFGPPTSVPVTINKPALRRDDAETADAVRSEQPGSRQAAARPAAPAAAAHADALPGEPGRRATRSVSRRRRRRARINDAGREHGQIRAFNNRTFDVDKGRADAGDAQRGLRPHLRGCWPTAPTWSSSSTSSIAPTRKAARSTTSSRRFPGTRQGAGSGDARRPPGFVARRDRRHRQRDWLRRDARGDPHSAGDRRQAAAHDSRGAVERRGTGAARIAGVREGALRHVRESEARVRELRRLLQHRFRHRPRARHDGLRPADGGRDAPRARSRRSPTTASWARRPRAAATAAAPITRRSTRRGCRASACSRIRSSTAPTRGTPTSTPTSASSRATRSSRRWRSRPRCITWRCATRSCRGSRRSRCRRCRRRATQ